MTIFFTKHRKKIALLFLVNFLFNFLYPLRALAITSGPSQPETQGFQPIGSSDMVDLFSGDFKYNIPLMDVGGYPLNISYNAGSGIDDEASWVGTGWSLTPGVVNRQMKALPDDFKGDEVKKTVNLKTKRRIGVAAEFKPDLFGWELGKIKLGYKLNLYKDNYYGWSAGLGMNASMDLLSAGAGTMTTDLGINSSSRDGAGISPSINLAYTWSKSDKQDKVGLNLGFDYNSRQGLQQQSLGLSYNHTSAPVKEAKNNRSTWGGDLSYVDNGVATYTPTVDIPRKNDAYTLSFHYGVELFGVKGEIGIDGSYSEEYIPGSLRSRSIPAYGYLYANETTKDNESQSLVDVNREKDVPYFKGTPVIPVPVLTNDNFLMSSQNGSGQFKILRKGSGIGHDPYLRTGGSSNTLGIDIGTGNIINFGGHIYRNQVISTTNKWNGKSNSYQSIGDYKDPNAANPLIQHAIFKKTGEMTQTNEDIYASLGKEKAVGIDVTAGSVVASPVAKKRLYDNNSKRYDLDANSFEPANRSKRIDDFSYLTALEAMRYGLDKYIYSYAPITSSSASGCSELTNRTRIPRMDVNRKAHHISEITVLDNQGKRMVYGIPVYNMEQQEMSFAVKPDASEISLAKQTGTVGYSATDASTGNLKGRENYFSKEEIPAYATSFLLTAIVSPDYRDLKNDGITDDDFGNAIKFNYTKLNGLYQWRTPYTPNKAGFNECLLADKDDDKANITYGKKEIWYAHSIESKNFVAIFYTSERLDGLGVLDINGGQNTTMRLQKLDSVALYSKPEFKHSGSKAIPIKVAVFNYDYTTGSQFPNSISTGTNGTGKLTLRRIHFTYGRNQKGATTPYQFSYKQSYTAGGTTVTNPNYSLQQTDKWGSYKPSGFNPVASDNGLPLTNGEFPYSIQDAAVAGELAGLWNLETIGLPSGGEIKIDYEADDYAYVQNKRACTMFTVAGVSNGGGFSASNTDFINANIIWVKSKQSYAQKDDLIKGLDYLYGKFYLTLRKNDVYDYVPGYAEIDKATGVIPGGSGSGYYYYGIPIKQVNPEGLPSGKYVNPFAVASWQFLRNNLPQYAYPGYDNGTAGVDNVGANVVGAIKALGQAVFNLTELFENYNKKYNRLDYANTINLSRSWVRLTEPTGKKIGGGHRVKKVTVRDNWGAMLGSTDYANNEYGQLYDYTTKDEDNNTISSGVASYEPGVGSDENPFKKPIPYSRKVKMGLDYNTYVEEPIGESYMPAPSVGYRKVTVKSFGASGANSENKIGYTENEFYTAKEFPTKIEQIGPAAIAYDPKLILTMVTSFSRSNMVTTQGLSVIQNDMHGKAKSVKTYDKNKDLISKVEYTYKVKDPAAVAQVLSNEVDLLKANGKVEKGTIGQDIEFYSDMRYQQTTNLGLRIGIYVGSSSFFIVLPFGGINIGGNASFVSFNSASTIKLITRCGIVESVTKMENGSTAITQNLMWDPETGDVLLTKTNNEFDQPVYNLTYPAHWLNKGMAPAYQNLESVLPNVSTSSTGQVSDPSNIINPAAITNLLQEGDELIDLTGNTTYWVISGVDEYANKVKFLIDRAGKKVASLSGVTLKVHYSGYRNLASTGIATIVSLNNPISNGQINVDASTRILDAKAVVYSDLWGMPIANTLALDEESSNSCISCSYGGDCFKNFLYALIGAKVGNNKPAIFSTYTDNQNAGSIMDMAATSPYSYLTSSPSSTCYSNFCGNTTAYENNYFKENLNNNIHYNLSTHRYEFTLIGGDKAYLGGRKITFQSVATRFNDLINLSTGTTGIWQEVFGTNSCKYMVKRSTFEGRCRYQLFYDPAAGPCYGAKSTGSTSTSAIINPCNLTPSSTAECILDVLMDYGKEYISYCADPVGNIINPYFYGIKGTWKPMQSYVYQVNRVNSVPGESSSQSNIKKNGYYALFNNFIDFNATNAYYATFTDPYDPQSTPIDPHSRWVWSQKSRYYTTKGEEIESEDALHRFTAALYGYKETLPIAVGKNTRYLEMNYDGFEDYYPSSIGAGAGCTEPCALFSADSFYIKNKLTETGISLVSTVAHSGKYSLQVANVPLILSATNSDYSNIDDPILTRASNEYVLSNNYLSQRFVSKQNKKYILSFWVKDPPLGSGEHLEFAPKIDVNINGVDQSIVASTKWPVVEGWKRIELAFDAGSASKLRIKIVPKSGKTVNIDDIRVFPVDAQMKSYAYDPITQRLMAELDENNFATFYEYDDEGTLQRVKKETERGIMTIKESRQHIRKTY